MDQKHSSSSSKRKPKPELKVFETSADFKIQLPMRNKKNELKIADLSFRDGFFPQAQSAHYLRELSKIDFDLYYSYFGQYSRFVTRGPRLMKWFSDLKDATYAFKKNDLGAVTLSTNEFSPRGLKPNPFPPVLQEIRTKIEKFLGVPSSHFNSALVNYYRDGNDSVAWHADQDPWLGTNFTVPSVSFGAERAFQVRANHPKNSPVSEFKLKNGSLLLMQGMTQEGFQHSVPKRGGKRIGPRINITFRRVLPSLISKNPLGRSWDETKAAFLKFYKDVLSEQDVASVLNASTPKTLYNMTSRLVKLKVASKKRT